LLKLKYFEDVKHSSVIENLIEKNDETIIAIFEVFDLTGDKADISENLFLCYKNGILNIIC
jgi:hypothetical protein